MPPKKTHNSKNPVYKNVCFTAYQDAELYGDEDLHHYLVFQREICPTSGREHWQGYLELKKNMRRDAIAESLGITPPIKDEKGDTIQPGGWHCELRKGTAQEADAYCRKKETRKPGSKICSMGPRPKDEPKKPGTRTDLLAPSALLREGKSMKDVALAHPVAIVKYARGFETLERLYKTIIPTDPEIKLRPWQQDLEIKIEAGPKKRQIFWVWSEKSSTGKSTTIDYLMHRYGTDKVLAGTWTYGDLLYTYDKHTIVVFDIPRSKTLHETHLEVLEKISNQGVQTSTKYGSCQKQVRCIVIVFANIPPPHAQQPDRHIEICIDPPEVIEARLKKTTQDSLLESSPEIDADYADYMAFKAARFAAQKYPLKTESKEEKKA